MAFFLKLNRNYLSKMRGCPMFSFWSPMVLTKIYFLRMVLDRTKILLYLKASPIGKPRVSQDAQNVCAITPPLNADKWRAVKIQRTRD